MSAPRLQIASRYRRSAHLEHDLWAGDALNGYVISQLARDAATRMTQEVAAESGGRAFSIVGPYGSGKSSFLTFLLRLWGWDPDALERLRHDASPAAPAISAAVDSLGTLVPVVVTGERGPLALAILRGLRRTADRVWTGKGKRPDVVRVALPELLARAEAGESVSDHQVADVVAGMAEKLHRSVGAHTDLAPQGGMVLVIDEMGKLLEWAALNPSRADLYLLQLLAERAARLAPARFTIVTVLHQEIVAYAESLPRAMREEWAKIGGRFEVIPYLESPHHLTALVAGALLLEPEQRRGPAFKYAQTVSKRLAEHAPAGLADAPLVACFPLHPVTALCIGPLFRRRVSQNERSLFAFLGSHEPHGFQDWLARADLTQPMSGLYRLDQLYDYVVSNIGTRAAAEPGERTWAVAESGLARLPADATDGDARLIKALALLTLLGPSVGLRTDVETLADATSATPKATADSLDRLARASIAVFKQFKAAWQLWDGSDLDVSALVERNRLKVEARGGFAEALNRLAPAEPVAATRLAFETGTIRALAARYVSEPEATGVAGNADGELLRVLPDRQEALPGIADLLEAGDVAPHDRPVVYALPVDPAQVYGALVEYLAVVETINSTAELESDPVARRELDERRVLAQDALFAALVPAFNSIWYHSGRRIEIKGRPTRAASEVLAAAFSSAPVVRNELVNRSDLSSAAAGARRELMERMLTRSGEVRLGIEGHPPELSIYRSVLESTGLHRPLDPELPEGAWTFAAPPAGSAMAPVWSRIEEILRRSAGHRATVPFLISAIAEPPYGVRAGVAPIMVLAWLLVHAEEVFWYEQNSFVTQLGTDHIHRLVRRPADFEIQVAGTTGDLGVLVAAFRRRGIVGPEVDARSAPLRIVRGLVKLVAGLSPYAANSQRLSVEARRARTALKAARDPVRLLTEALPEALGAARPAGVPAFDDQTADQYAIALAAALRELARSDQLLFDGVETIIAALLGAADSGAQFRGELASRARMLAQSKVELPPITKRLVDLTLPLGDAPHDRETREIWLTGVGTAVLGKAPAHWTDADYDRFRLIAVEPCRSFVAAEQLALELGKIEDAPVRLVRVSMLDSRGERRVGVGVLRHEDAKQVSAFEAEVVALAKRRGISTPGLVYAVISGMMAHIDGTSVQENRQDERYRVER